MEKSGQFILCETIQEFSDWLDEEPVLRKVYLVQNHCTWLPDYKLFKGDNHFQMCKAMKDYHVNNRKFADIAQNITIFPDGKIVICRPLEVAPAGIKGANSHGICIENVGNFDKGGDVMTEDQKASIIAVNALLLAAFKLEVNTDTVVYHHWYDRDTGEKTWGTGSVKSCPGTNFFGGNSKEACELNFLPLIRSFTTETLRALSGTKNLKL